MLKRAAASLAGTLILGLPALAQELVVEQTVERVIVVEDEEGGMEMELLPAEEAKSGEQLFYSVTYLNESEEPATNVVLTLPVPDDVSLLEDSAVAEYDEAFVDFSVDGGKTYISGARLVSDTATPAHLEIPEEITHMRWTFNQSIPPNESGKIFFAGILK